MAIRASEAVKQAHQRSGRPLHRSTIVATAGTPKDSSNASAGASVTYTFVGGEVLLLQPSAAGHFEVCASAAYGAAGIRGIELAADEKYVLTLTDADTKISWDPASGTESLKIFQLL